MDYRSTTRMAKIPLKYHILVYGILDAYIIVH